MVSAFKIKNLILILFLVIAIVVAAIFCIRNQSQIQNTLYLATHKLPTKLTELYFEEPNKLPKTLDKSRKLAFAFNIYNQEGSDLTYNYKVYSESNGEKFMILDSNEAIKNGYNKRITVSSTLPHNSRQRIIVELIDKQQTISFLLN